MSKRKIRNTVGAAVLSTYSNHHTIYHSCNQLMSRMLPVSEIDVGKEVILFEKSRENELYQRPSAPPRCSDRIKMFGEFS